MTTGDDRTRKFSIYLSARLNAALDELAEIDERSKTNLVIFSLKMLIAARDRDGRPLVRVASPEERDVKLTIRIPIALARDLKRVAAADARSMSQWAGLALDALVTERKRDRDRRGG